MQEMIKLKAGRFLIPCRMIKDDGRIHLYFPYNKILLGEVKSMEGRKWHPEDKHWSFSDCERNRFALDFLLMKNPYERFLNPRIPYTSDRPLLNNQKDLVSAALTTKQAIWAAEMGLGKTLAAIEVMETVYKENPVMNLFWYVGPRAGVRVMDREVWKWKSKVFPRTLTYNELTRIVERDEIDVIPKVLILDESSKIKNPNAKRSKAAKILTEKMRAYWKNDCYIIEMSGTPAPKDPTNWWHQCEVLCPGFIKEGTIQEFKRRLCLMEECEASDGVKYPKIITWLDDENKCAICGMEKNHPNHDEMSSLVEGTNCHSWKASVNEVANLYNRLKGIVTIQLKKDFSDLPEKRFETIYVKPDPETIRAAQLIRKTSRNTVTALIRLRELSDGFQYTQTITGAEVCPNCDGRKKVLVPVPKNFDIHGPNTQEIQYENEIVICDCCGGKGEIPTYERGTTHVACPKDQIFIDELEECEEMGRYVVWGGFTGTIDRLVKIAHQQGWATLRIDKQGFIGESALGEFISSSDLLDAMDRSHPRFKELLDVYPRVVVVGNPEAGGMAITLTGSCVALYYSCTYNGEAHMQSLDRIHRHGMDVNKGALIKFIIHLPTDKLVLDNLTKKINLQSLSMGELERALNV